MQAGSRRGNRAAFAGKDGLVALPVFVRIGAVNVRRQRHVADALERRPEIFNRRKTQQIARQKLPRSSTSAVEFDFPDGGGKDETFADCDLSARFDKGAPLVLSDAVR